MVHAASREAALERVDEIAALIAAEFPGACRGRDVLFSAGILKKTGLRIGGLGTAGAPHARPTRLSAARPGHP
jgi:hypothetical protein